ncbi:MAG: hypothetical protein COT81_01310 [Candidatus Buchananbacteria bacterium CG10_big_fil_rev_8_21_14_0_10_42_9]|uniref:Antitoxin n=1 Tax=Candidatus Buchananbacteria bacterium CG10_big_fil_rev_8_21_14_0_10_42_9 TaxID=1974526 RepID=A0A2H0W420_9BACT|nr:MAG: hypothetical protein COT81_01310 [Candidatus Buchananbacteria bacterium CG10_big_fil_rev_8_21_14_0_10_42_9]
MATNWEKLAKLVKQTGDSVIVVNEQGEPQYVLMDIKKYERLVDISKVVDEAVSNHVKQEAFPPEKNNPVNAEKDVSIDKIKQQISTWKKNHPVENSFAKSEKTDKPFDVFAAPQAEDKSANIANRGNANDSDTYYFEPED